MNKFEKVSYEQYRKSKENISDYSEEEIRAEYENIRLPKRATIGSAGYDIFSPFDFILKAGKTIKFPTGIRVLLDSDKFLAIYPRSGLGYKYRVQLDNTVGIIDSDYYQSDNEGQIYIKLTNDSRERKPVEIKAGEAIAQGIITQFFKTDDDNADGIRNGGFGSTDRKEV